MSELDFDDMLKGLNIGYGEDIKSSKVDKKGTSKTLDAKPEKKKTPVEPMYEGYTLRPATPPVGEKKSWTRFSMTPLPFDSLQLYTIGNNHKKKPGKDVVSIRRELTDTQQYMINRVIEERKQDETNPNAIWVPFDLRRISEEVPRGIFLVGRQVASIEFIIRRKDKNSMTGVDKPTSTTTTSFNSLGKVIDLNVPMKLRPIVSEHSKQERGERGEKVNKVKKEKAGNDALDFNQLLKEVQSEQRQQHEDDRVPENPDPSRYFWNGSFYEEIRAEQQQQHQHVVHDAPRNDWQYQNQQPNYPRQVQQMPHAPEVAAAQPHWQSHPQHNPFQPMYAHPEQFAEVPQPAHHHAYPEHSPRHEDDFSRSRSRQRRPARRHSRHRHTPSMSSSEADAVYSDFTPPSTPPRDEFPPGGPFGRRKSQRYYQEVRSRYPDDRIEMRPHITYREQGDERRFVSRPRSAAIVHDDYPRFRITNYAEGYEDAGFRPRRDHYEPVRDERRGRRRPSGVSQRDILYVR